MSCRISGRVGPKHCVPDLASAFGVRKSPCAFSSHHETALTVQAFRHVLRKKSKSGRGHCTLHTSSHSETRIVESQKVTFRSPQSQRDCASKPRVARNELPWVNVQRRTQPQRGCGTAPSQPLGWTTLSLALKIRVRCSVPGRSSVNKQKRS